MADGGEMDVKDLLFESALEVTTHDGFQVVLGLIQSLVMLPEYTLCGI